MALISGLSRNGVEGLEPCANIGKPVPRSASQRPPEELIEYPKAKRGEGVRSASSTPSLDGLEQIHSKG